MRGEGKQQAVACSKNFELIIQRLDRQRNENPGSLVDQDVDEENHAPSGPKLLLCFWVLGITFQANT